MNFPLVHKNLHVTFLKSIIENIQKKVVSSKRSLGGPLDRLGGVKKASLEWKPCITNAIREPRGDYVSTI